MLSLTERLGWRLRTEAQITRRLTLTVHYADRTNTTKSRTLAEPTSHSTALTQAGYELYESLALQRARVRGIAMRAQDLLAASDMVHQLTFDPADEARRRVEAAADRPRARFGSHVIGPAALA